MPSKRPAGVVPGRASKALKAAKNPATSAPSRPTPPPVVQAPPDSSGDDDNDNEGGDDDDDYEPVQSISREGLEKMDRVANSFDLNRFTSRSKNVGGVFGNSDAKYPCYPTRDFSSLPLKPDHPNRPLWIDPIKGTLLLERFSPLSAPATDFLITIAEPRSRPTFIHEYALTAHSLYAAVSAGLNPKDVMGALDRFMKTPLPDSIRQFIESCTKSYGKVKLVLKDTKYFVESSDQNLLQKLLKDEVIGKLRVHGSNVITTTNAPKMAGLVIPGTQNAAGVKQAADGSVSKPDGKISKPPDDGTEPTVNLAVDDDDDDDDEAVHSFEIPDSAVETVQKRCLDLNYPILEEYDFRKDHVNANLDIDLRPNTQIRPYQEKSLSKMFGNGRAKSGIIVLPCGAGKTLVGITAACTIKKGCIVLCTSSMSVVQWRQEFLKWSNINPDDIAIFTAENKNKFPGNTGIIVTTYSMVTNSRERSHDSKKMMDFLRGREWGLMLLDEVHVVPAEVFRRVISSIKSHSKLGLTATLLREDDKISHLNFLIGPKLFEANWMELSQQGHIARVQCAEVLCQMPPEWYEEYLRTNSRMRRILYAMNPSKFQACQYLINYHEGRGDKIIVFSDELYPLKQYALKLGKVFIYGGTSQAERIQVLENFQHNPQVNTLFLSKIGDTSLDLPEATVLVQISSHFGSRRQEAQRLGRILRAKRRNDEGFSAFFYSLVSKDTTEVLYSSKRQAFLVDQGYAFKVITALTNIDQLPDLAFSTPTERRELLQRTLVDNEKGLDEEEVIDDLFHSNVRSGRKKAGAAVRRTAGMLSELSGGQDMAYVEQKQAANKALKKRKQKVQHSAFFNKIAREKEKVRKG